MCDTAQRSTGISVRRDARPLSRHTFDNSGMDSSPRGRTPSATPAEAVAHGQWSTPREEPSAAQRDRYEAATSADRPAGHQVEESVTARVLSYARHHRGVFNVRPAVNPMAESALPQCLARHGRSPRTKPPSVHPCSPSSRTYCLLRVVMRANPRPAVASGRACAGRGGLPYEARFVVAASPRSWQCSPSIKSCMHGRERKVACHDTGQRVS